jgi:prepilin-type processing-associated H-X9-DG protein
MPIDEQPQDAANIAFFDGNAASNAASIKYSVPLPGAYSFGRIVPCAVPDDWFKAEAKSAGTSLMDLGVAKVDANDNKILSLDGEKLKLLFRNVVSHTARPSMRLASEANVRLTITDPKSPAAPVSEGTVAQGSDGESLDVQNIRRDKFLDAMADSSSAAATTSKAFTMPVRGFGHSLYPIPVEVPQTTPKLALVETYQISASLGDYGLGRTLQTYSLLPGERTTITVETWRTFEAAREDASSIFDSSDTAAQTRFTSAVVSETGTASQDQGGWALSLGLQAKASAPIEMVAGEASFTAGFTANHQEARQQFANNVSQSASEHASQVNAARQHSVQAKTVSKQAGGSSDTTVREIANTNLRRVLNFVFRELNQAYTVTTSLRNVRVAFYNGNVDSAQIVSLAELSSLLRKYIVDAHRKEAALGILALVTECIDADGAQ